MNQVEKVKKMCKERGVRISKLEKDLGFSNGYIGQLKRGTFPADRLEKIASYFRVDYHYFLDDVSDPAAAAGLSDDETELLRLFRLLNSDGRAQALEQVENLAQLPKYTNKNKESCISDAI